MPVRPVIRISENITAAIWDITEPEEELLSLAHPDDEELTLYRTFRHPGRKLQWLSVRALLKTLFNDVKIKILYTPTGKPFLENRDIAISVSHTASHAAVAISASTQPGIDIERVQPRLRKVAGRFLNEAELKWLPIYPTDEQLCLMWCIKEAVFKIHGEPGLDIRDHIHVLPNDYFCTFPFAGEARAVLRDADFRHTVHAGLNDGLMMAVCY